MQPLKLLVVEDNIPSLELMTEVFMSLKAMPGGPERLPRPRKAVM